MGPLKGIKIIEMAGIGPGPFLWNGFSRFRCRSY
ncbi:MAG: hypothetical protein Ct9H90mP4_02380 [Gammaproteobacteria bacterium]|nr:MAG: hypothetical protein Ct9H90mP4_02380 [Gammaproteobacteria bacterium]